MTFFNVGGGSGCHQGVNLYGDWDDTTGSGTSTNASAIGTVFNTDWELIECDAATAPEPLDRHSPWLR
jgi:hypothetical protein